MATTIAGLLMFYQIQESTSFEESTKAVYAADAGLERAIYYYYHELSPGKKCYPEPCEVSVDDMPGMSNGTEVSAEILAPPGLGETVEITARGEAGRTVRLLQTTFSSFF